MDVVILWDLNGPMAIHGPHTAPADFRMAKTYVRHRIRAPHGCVAGDGESVRYGVTKLNTKIPTISDGMVSDWE